MHTAQLPSNTPTGYNIGKWSDLLKADIQTDIQLDIQTDILEAIQLDILQTKKMASVEAIKKWGSK